jgi:hypothetical protein
VRPGIHAQWWPRAGDTEDRGAFYDAWLNGCIPVISNYSVDVYATRLHHGALFATRQAFLDTVVVVEDPEDAPGLLQRLLAEAQGGKAQQRREQLLARLDALVYHRDWPSTTTMDAVSLMLNQLAAGHLRPQPQAGEPYHNVPWLNRRFGPA